MTRRRFAPKSDSSSEVSHWLDQDYEQIKKEFAGQKWTDSTFPANDESLSPDGSLLPRHLTCEWKRPEEICSDAKFFVGEASRFDLNMSSTGNSWFVAAAMSLCMNPSLLNQVVPKDQDMQDGVCRFRFCDYGNWTEVVVDTLLPTVQGQLYFTSSRDSNEFWSALLEKAYAKYLGSYNELLQGGSVGDTLVDFTGGVVEKFQIQPQAKPGFYDLMLKSVSTGSLLTCQVANMIRGSIGLSLGMDYSITDVKKVDTASAKAELIRMRSCLSGDTEWSGRWSDGSEQWNTISDEDRMALGLTYDSNGEFWIDFDDFQKYFANATICGMGPSSAADSSKSWYGETHQGRWLKGATAGGSLRSPTFHMNQQFRVEIDADEEDGQGTLVVSIMQERRKSAKPHRISYVIYELTPEDIEKYNILPSEFFRSRRPAAMSNTFLAARENTGRHRLAAGHYAVIPCTFNSDDEGDFLLRLYSTRPTKSSPMDEETTVDPAARRPPQSPTDEKLHSMFMQVAGTDGGLDAYELQVLLTRMLKKDNSEGIDIETARTLVSLNTNAIDGQLKFEEFKVLLAKIKMWQKAFEQGDEDKSGAIDVRELQRVLAETGVRVSIQVLQGICAKYRNKHGAINMGEFFTIMTRIDALTEMMDELDPEKTGHVTMTRAEFIGTFVHF